MSMTASHSYWPHSSYITPLLMRQLVWVAHCGQARLLGKCDSKPAFKLLPIFPAEEGNGKITLACFLLGIPHGWSLHELVATQQHILLIEFIK